ncbi:MAG: MCP four helix bundle domain-containing protein, partial [Tardiphaga sp.]
MHAASSNPENAIRAVARQRSKTEGPSPMFASLSIRTKITLVVSFLLLAMSAMGVLAIKQMYTINGATSDIVTSWLPSVRSLGEVRAATISYRSVVRGHLLATDAADTKVQDDTLVRYAEMLDKARK